MLIDEKRGIEEQYTSAMTSSDLRVEADRRSDADILIAAGWNQSRIGGALLRLHTEFDASEKPRVMVAEDLLPKLTAEATAGGRKLSKLDREMLKQRARREAHAHNLHETSLLLGKLKALPDVRTQTTLQLVKWGVEQAEEKAVQVIRWWLAQSCPACQGTKFQLVEGTNRQSSKACKTCHGTGLREIPHSQDGRRLANWMDQCVQRARSAMSKRLWASEPALVDKPIQKA